MLLQFNDICANRAIYRLPAYEPRITDMTDECRSDFVDLLVGLDRPSRCSRFGFAANDAILAKHAGTAIERASKVIGIYTDKRLRGVLEAYPCSNEGPTKIAVVVDQNWRRQGLGIALIYSAQQWASSQQLQVLRLIFSRANWPMRHLAHKLNARLDVLLDELCADIVVGSPRERWNTTTYIKDHSSQAFDGGEHDSC
jgi:GNAT superfamily N-acetyltransferase